MFFPSPSLFPPFPQLKPDIHVLTILVVGTDANAGHCNEFYSSYSKSLGLLLHEERLSIAVKYCKIMWSISTGN